MDVYKELVDISYNWYDLGLQLELTEGKLKNIQGANPEDPQHCMQEMLSTWLRQVDPRPTWHVLCAALRSRTVGEKELASTIEAKYIKCKSDHMHVAASPLHLQYSHPCLLCCLLLFVFLYIVYLHRHLFVLFLYK